MKARLLNLRQQSEHRAGVPHRSLADFVAPKTSGLRDYVGGFAVTTGMGADERVKAFKAANDDYNAILLESLADRWPKPLLSGCTSVCVRSSGVISPMNT